MTITNQGTVAHKGRRPLAKNPRISRRMRRAVDAFITGEAKTQKAAAELAGLNRSHFNREYQKPHIQAFVQRRSAELFSALLPKAVRALSEVLEGGNAQAQLNAALAVLRQHGIVASDGTPPVSVHIEAPGYVIDLSGGPGSAPRLIDGDLGTVVDAPRADAGHND